MNESSFIVSKSYEYLTLNELNIIVLLNYLFLNVVNVMFDDCQSSRLYAAGSF